MNAAITISSESPKVFSSNGRMVTTSQAVADYFDKQHKDVLRKIDMLDCSPEFTSANFYADVQTIGIGNGAERESRCFLITKDGFMFLVMGFTGKKAARLKESYIAKFNKMEAELQNRPAIPVQHTPSQSYSMIVYFENGIPVSSRPLGEGEIVMHPDSCFEHIMRAGFVTIPCDEVETITMGELWKMAEDTRNLRDRVRKNYQELAARYDF